MEAHRRRALAAGVLLASPERRTEESEKRAECVWRGSRTRSNYPLPFPGSGKRFRVVDKVVEVGQLLFTSGKV